ncbi:cellulose synthase [Pandoraea fibrosis]|uniref:Cellulose synthase n=1 Tax=Pandoraea fibrosis TaxID=1891094 RepID=A0A5E4TAL8_9BURK|nr:cellulose synthase [Pandoraea fibrosis]VVD85180.1 cellulose synthase [Pandoraea fibrosis]
MTSKQKLTILEVTRRQGISSKTGRPYDMRTTQCILWPNSSDDPRRIVGAITLPEFAKETPKGEYFAEFAMTQSMDCHLVPRIVALHPYVSDARPTATLKAAAGAKATASAAT